MYTCAECECNKDWVEAPCRGCHRPMCFRCVKEFSGICAHCRASVDKVDKGTFTALNYHNGAERMLTLAFDPTDEGLIVEVWRDRHVPKPTITIYLSNLQTIELLGYIRGVLRDGRGEIS